MSFDIIRTVFLNGKNQNQNFSESYSFSLVEIARLLRIESFEVIEQLRALHKNKIISLSVEELSFCYRLRAGFSVEEAELKALAIY